MIMWKRFEFEASHKLPWHTGKCKDLHGHTYRLEIGLKGEVNRAEEASNSGMIADFSEVKQIVTEKIVDKFDHKHLNDFFKNPTAELIAEYIYDVLSVCFTHKITVRLWETSNSWVEVNEDSDKRDI